MGPGRPPGQALALYRRTGLTQLWSIGAKFPAKFDAPSGFAVVTPEENASLHRELTGSPGNWFALDAIFKFGEGFS